MIRNTVFVILLLCAAPTAFADANGLHTINGMPLYIDGANSASPQPSLSSSLIDQVRTVKTLGAALRILGPAYAAPDDSLHIPHWHFQNGTMLTLWPQGGEALTDTVFIRPRPDCGVPANQCQDLILDRKKNQAQAQPQQQPGSNLSSVQSFQPLMNQVAQQHGVSPTTQAVGNTLIKLAPGR